MATLEINFSTEGSKEAKNLVNILKQLEKMYTIIGGEASVSLKGDKKINIMPTGIGNIRDIRLYKKPNAPGAILLEQEIDHSLYQIGDYEVNVYRK